MRGPGPPKEVRPSRRKTANYLAAKFPLVPGDGSAGFCSGAMRQVPPCARQGTEVSQSITLNPGKMLSFFRKIRQR